LSGIFHFTLHIGILRATPVAVVISNGGCSTHEEVLYTACSYRNGHDSVDAGFCCKEAQEESLDSPDFKQEAHQARQEKGCQEGREEGPVSNNPGGNHYLDRQVIPGIRNAVLSKLIFA
jgi:hypothetical protein